jgi:hypothetical protein
MLGKRKGCHHPENHLLVFGGGGEIVDPRHDATLIYGAGGTGKSSLPVALVNASGMWKSHYF